jgi:hypothetical protein
MSAPDRIWALPWERDDEGVVWWGKGDWHVVLSDEAGYVAYVRADIHDSEIAHLNLRMLQQAERIAELEAMLIRRAGGK